MIAIFLTTAKLRSVGNTTLVLKFYVSNAILAIGLTALMVVQLVERVVTKESISLLLAKDIIIPFVLLALLADLIKFLKHLVLEISQPILTFAKVFHLLLNVLELSPNTV